MQNQDFSITLLVDQSPEQAFRAINNVRGWWSETIEGGTEKLHDEFIYRHKDMHYSRHKLTGLTENKRVEWLVTDSQLYFLKEQHEWTGTRISFEISRQGDKTAIRFTHHGLVPGIECYEACTGGWNYYIQSLYKLVTTGNGHPDKKETAAAGPRPVQQ